MATVTPYLFFDGNCREAMEFYRSCLGGKLEVMTYGDTQGEACPLALKEKVMHAAISEGPLLLMASDKPDGTVQQGRNVHIAFNGDSVEQLGAIFAALAEDGEITYALHDAPWGDRFGTLTDRYRVPWMFSCRLEK